MIIQELQKTVHTIGRSSDPCDRFTAVMTVMFIIVHHPYSII